MSDPTVFRISGAMLADDKLAAEFNSDAYPERRIYKLFRKHTSDALLEVTAQQGVEFVVLKISGGPLLILHPGQAADLFDSAGIHGKGNPDDVTVTSALPWTASRPGRMFGRKLMPADASGDWFAIVRYDAIAAAQVENAKGLLADLHVSKLMQVTPHGCEPAAANEAPDADLDTWPAAGSGEDAPSFLVLLHGTLVQSTETFRALWECAEDGSNPMQALIDTYGPGKVLAFDYPAMLQGPIQNALTLVARLPTNATIDLLTHGAGGLLAEVLVRAASGDDPYASRERFDSDDEWNALQALRESLRRKAIKVRRVVRVACPVRGALLTGERANAWLSVSLWLARVSGVQCDAGWFGLIAEYALDPQKAEALPGLTAMHPDSRLIAWLNAPLAPVDSELYVLAGDSEGDNLFGWLQSLVSEALLWTDTDLVFQTRAMYGGVPRAHGQAGPRALLVRDDRITHFSYFQRSQIVDTILSALRGEVTASAQAGGEPGFEPPVPEALAWVPILPQAPLAVAADQAPPASPADRRKPWLLLVPDLFCSSLPVPDHRGTAMPDDVELAALATLSSPVSGASIDVAQQLFQANYSDLRRHFERTHQVVTFPYDWRIDLAHSAATLAARVDEILRMPKAGEQAVRILAHGMGGLLVRAWHALHTESWDRFAARAGARLLMLGVPNAGSWLALRLFSGDETFGTLLTSGRSISAERTLRHRMAAMPGIVQLQAGLTSARAPLGQPSNWKALEDAEYRGQRVRNRWHGLAAGKDRLQLDDWGIPPAETLERARQFWEQLERALPALLGDRDKLVLVAGTGWPTVAGVETTSEELFLLTSRDGDRQVTLDSGAMPDIPLWLVTAPHDALTRTRSVFGALSDLIERGSTDQLACRSARRALRSGADAPRPLTRRLPSHGGRVFCAPGPSDPPSAIPGAEDGVDDVLAVKVCHGDLRFVREPLLVGHYRSMILTGTEAAVDGLVRERMSRALRTGVYPERVGSFQIFENGRQQNVGRRKQRYIPRPHAVVIAGLGEEGKLTAQELAYTVRIGVLAYAERFSEANEHQDSFELAATLVGSGGTGVTVSMAAIALLQGILEANVRLREAGWPIVTTLTIVELYLDRATEALRVLNMQAASSTQLRVGKLLETGDGGLRRPVDTSYRGAGYDFISALKSAGSTADNPVIAYALDTRRARTEVRAQHSQGPLVRDLVCKSANTTLWDRQIGRTLFNLLIPVEIEPYLTGSADMVMELDDTTAALPWEMLDTDPPRAPLQQSDALPWAIRCKVLRKLRTDGYRQQVRDAATEDKILIIGDPLTHGPAYPPLLGARAEASSVAAVARTSLRLYRDHVVELNERPNATTIINALFASSYRIVHIAGHGSEPQGAGCGASGGVVLSGENTFLGANEVRAMRVTPELVFLNCCHLAKLSSGHDYDRVAFAASIARELIDIGVRCVIAAGWAIEDAPAEVFATTFYREIFGGRRFIDAIGAARTAAYQNKRDSNTWAAYQCYGDPDWSWNIASGSAQLTPEQEYDGIAAPVSLILALQALRSDLLYTARDTSARNRARLQYLLKQFPQWAGRGDVAEEFAAAFAALPEREVAIKWYDAATRAKDGSGSITTVELHAEQLSLPHSPAQDLRKAIGMFEQMDVRYGKSLQRLSLRGNAYRRLSVLLEKTSPPGDAQEKGTPGWHLEQARISYSQAARCEQEAVNRFYPLRAMVSCRVRAALLQGIYRDADAPGTASTATAQLTGEFLEREYAEVVLAIGRALRVNPNFWPIVAQSELEILRGIVKRNLAARQQDISASLRDLHKRISTPRFWEYVHDDASAVLEPYLRLMAPAAASHEARAAQALCQQLADYGAKPAASSVGPP